MSRGTRILVADDDPSVRRLLALRLQDAGYEVQSAADGQEALNLIGSFQPQLVLTDLRMPGLDGMALFGAVRQRYPGLPVIILTAHGTIPDAVEATRSGVFGYLTKPFDSKQLLEWVQNALRLGGGPGGAPESTLGKRWREDIITRNAEMESLLRQGVMAAIGDTPILIQGETGTGKTLLARALHRASARCERPFLTTNAAVIPETLLESEFFGHDTRAFTGDGLFQRADGGTLFIDEIDALPPDFQVSLLQALQDRQIRPRGSTRPLPADVRVISATRCSLDGAAQQRLREDLYYYLSVVPLIIPPLTDRRDDIPLLAAHFLEAAAKRSGKTVNGFSPQAMERLLAAPWPGNVRELRHVVERAAALSEAPLIAEDLINRTLQGKRGDELGSLTEARDQFERDYLTQLLRITAGNVSQAARMAGRNRTEFYKLLHRHHLDPQRFRDDESR
ncbi:MAG TPA: sigma 54-interacting transcriptional regulator [Gammaproteobacteria bacterium]|nr:sigma 54-interacting transcriptional regulator [Gammaproteobacteria bacterium]HET7588115.1 sigma 54-interacting transcriptional regulator [Gammaproteobacteria bacterium]